MPSHPHFALFRLLALAILLVLPGCYKKGGEAIVLSKTHVTPPPKIEQEAEPEPGQTPKPTPREEWKIQVEMKDDMRQVSVYLDKEEWERLKIGDRVQVRYSQGKYTGTVWYAELR